MARYVKLKDRSLGKWKKKLDSNQQMELCKRIAWHWRAPEILEWLEKDHNVKICRELIYKYKNQERWIPVIDKFREEYFKNVTEVPLANKRKRLDELQKFFEKSLEKGKDKECIAIIREFRDEMERKVADVSFNFTNITHNEFHDMSDEDLQREKVRTLEQLEKLRKMKLLGGPNGLGSEDSQEIEEIEEKKE